MTIGVLLVGILVLAFSVLAFLIGSRQKKAVPRVKARPVPAAVSGSERMGKPRPTMYTPPDAVLAPPSPPGAPVPQQLGGFQLMREEDIDEQRRDDLVGKLGRVPQPPHVVHNLLSPAFLRSCNAKDLSDIIIRDPLLAAKVLATVNSSYYGLLKPVTSVGHATTFLGIDAIRDLALQFLMRESFKSESPELQKSYARIWAASMAATELCRRLSQKLNMPDNGVLSTNILLSFIGHLVMHNLLPVESIEAAGNAGLLSRTMAEQEHTGVNSAIVGSFLMKEWSLPQSIIEETRDAILIMVTPPEEMDAQRGARLAFCYACSRIGEMIASGTIQDLADLDLNAADDPDIFYLKSYLKQPALASFQEHLHAPDTVAAMAKMMAFMAK